MTWRGKVRHNYNDKRSAEAANWTIPKAGKPGSDNPCDTA